MARIKIVLRHEKSAEGIGIYKDCVKVFFPDFRTLNALRNKFEKLQLWEWYTYTETIKNGKPTNFSVDAITYYGDGSLYDNNYADRNNNVGDYNSAKLVRLGLRSSTKDIIRDQEQKAGLMYSLSRTTRIGDDGHSDQNNAPNFDLSIDGVYGYIDYSLKVPTIKNFNVSTNGIVDQSISVSFEATLCDKMDLNVNGTIIEGITSGFNIPKRHLKVGENTFELIAHNIVSNSHIGSVSEQTRSSVITKTLNTLVPTISNVTLTNSGWLVENETVVRWQSTNQLSYRISVNDKVVTSGTTSKEGKIPAGACVAGSNTIKVEVIKNAVNGVANSERIVFHEVIKDYTRISPVIDTITVSGLNRDYLSAITWAGANFTEAKLYINKVYKGTFPSNATRYDTAAGELVKGVNEFKVVAIKKTSFDTLESEKVITKTIIQDEPLIYSLEPSVVEIDSEKTNTLSFTTNSFCSRWELYLNDVLSYRGTSERSVTALAGQLRIGTNTLRLVSYYSPSWSTQEVRSVVKESSFTGYGKPNMVRHDGTEIYRTATPTFEWDYDTSPNNYQYEFEIKVLEGSSVIETKKVIGYDRSYTMTRSLENNKTYTVMISIKNKHGKWSDWSAKTIRTSFNNLPVPTVSISKANNAVLITANCSTASSFKQLSILRKVGTEWIEIAYNLNRGDTIKDFAIPSGCEVQYKVRLYDTSGGYSDSRTVTTKLQLINYHLTDLKGEDFQIDFAKLTETHNTDKVYKVFAGHSKTTVYSNQTNYKTYQLAVTIFNDEATTFNKLFSKSETLCFRDYRGNKIYCDLTVNGITHEKGYATAQITLTEIEFEERRMYKGTIPNRDERAVSYAN